MFFPIIIGGLVGFIISGNIDYQELIDEVTKASNIVKQYIDPTFKPQPIKATEQPEIVAPVKDAYTSKTILVVDDSNIVRNFVKRIFSETYNVGVAENGEEAISIIDANKDNENIVAILLDLNMPKVDGFAVLDYMNK